MGQRFTHQQNHGRAPGHTWLSLTSLQRGRGAHLSAGVPPGEEEKGLHHGALVSQPYPSGLGPCLREPTRPSSQPKACPAASSCAREEKGPEPWKGADKE